MAYSTSDRFELITQAPLAAAGRTWYHESADALAAVNTDGFITDGTKKGLKVGDFVQHKNTASNGDLSLHQVLSISSTYPGAVDLSDGTVISAGADAD